jgi:hypothetical protein
MVMVVILSALVVVVPSSVVWASTGLLMVSIALINKRLLNFEYFFHIDILLEVTFAIFMP